MSDNISGQDGRQGKGGRPARYVLIVSVGLMLTSLAGLMIWQGANASPDYASQSQAASRRQITGSGTGTAEAPSSANSTGVSGGNPAYPQPALRSVSP